MRKLLYGLVCCATLMACQQEEGYRIIGSVPGAPDGTKVYMFDLWTPLDSAVMKGGKFEMRGKVETPNLYRICLDMSPENPLIYKRKFLGGNVFVENSVIRYDCESIDSMPGFYYGNKNTPENLKITGSRTHDLYTEYLNSLQEPRSELNAAWQEYLQVYHIPSSEGVFRTREGLALTRKMRDAAKQIDQIRKTFIEANPASIVSILVAQERLGKGKVSLRMTKGEIEWMLQSIDISLRNSDAYLKLKESAEKLYPTSCGERYMDIELVNEKGESVRLKDFVKPGQYNMLEFWSSGCGPCRAEIPHLKHVAKLYGDDKFHLISISIDRNAKDWHKALREENMPWTQLCDMKGSKGEVSTKYHVAGIPFSLILDGEGRIVATGVRGSDLDLVLIEHLGDKFEK